MTGSAELAGVVLYVTDVDRAARFYAAVLGTDVVDRGDRFAVLTLGAAQLSLVAMPSEVAALVTAPPEIREETAVKPSFLVGSIVDAAESARAHGGGAKPVEQAWQFGGRRHLDGFDPEGNVIQFVETVPADPPR